MDQTSAPMQMDMSVELPARAAPVEQVQPQKGRRSRRVMTKERASKVPSTPGRRSSIYRGVTRHRWTGRYEAHLWDKSCWNQTQNKKGRQVYLGAYDDEDAAARAYDLAALKYWGPGTKINFPLTDYTKEVEEMRDVSKEEYLASLRRKSSGFSRGVSKYRGVARHHHNGRWEARIGRIFGNKYLYLGTYSTQEEAAAAYDMAAIEYRGLNAVTNFDLSRYIKWLRPGQGTSVATVEPTVCVMPAPRIQESLPGLTTPEPSQDSLEQQCSLSSMWEASQACDEAYSQLANASANSKCSSSPTALGFLLQSSMFKQMMERASSGGSLSETLEDPCDQSLSTFNGDVKHELTFQEEVRHVFDQTEMPLVDQSDDLAFGPSSNLDRMFFQSDMTFPYLPVGASSVDDQGSLLDSVISPFSSLNLPYAISTCS